MLILVKTLVYFCESTFWNLTMYFLYFHTLNCKSQCLCVNCGHLLSMVGVGEHNFFLIVVRDLPSLLAMYENFKHLDHSQWWWLVLFLTSVLVENQCDGLFTWLWSKSLKFWSMARSECRSPTTIKNFFALLPLPLILNNHD